MLTLAAVERLVAEGCRLVLVACNTASAVALRRLQQEWLPSAAPEHRVLGVFVPMVAVLAGVSWRDGAAMPDTRNSGQVAPDGIGKLNRATEANTFAAVAPMTPVRSEEHTSEPQS